MTKEVFGDWIVIKEAFLLGASVTLPERGDDDAKYWNALCEIERETLRNSILAMMEKQKTK